MATSEGPTKLGPDDKPGQVWHGTLHLRGEIAADFISLSQDGKKVSGLWEDRTPNTKRPADTITVRRQLRPIPSQSARWRIGDQWRPGDGKLSRSARTEPSSGGQDRPRPQVDVLCYFVFIKGQYPEVASSQEIRDDPANSSSHGYQDRRASGLSGQGEKMSHGLSLREDKDP